MSSGPTSELCSYHEVKEWDPKLRKKFDTHSSGPVQERVIRARKGFPRGFPAWHVFKRKRIIFFQTCHAHAHVTCVRATLQVVLSAASRVHVQAARAPCALSTQIQTRELFFTKAADKCTPYPVTTPVSVWEHLFAVLGNLWSESASRCQ